MAYFFGIDGGNSKTHALIINELGNVYGFGASGGSDFHEIGIELAQEVWESAINQALSQKGLKRKDFQCGCFCLAGADLPEDYELLESVVEKIAFPMKVVVKNDSIAALRAGLHKKTFGVTVVVGTGFNAAGWGKNGEEIVLPGLGFISGDYGGGRWLSRQIIRAVMRAWDGRGQKTTLRERVFTKMGVQDEIELIRCLHKGNYRDQILELVPALFDAAYEGDEVAQSLVIFIGREVGETANALIRRLSLQDEEVPIILSTSVFRGKGPLFLDVITETVHRTAPKARILMPEFVPVIGATLEAISVSGIPIQQALLDNLRKELRDRYQGLIHNEISSLA